MRSLLLPTLGLTLFAVSFSSAAEPLVIAHRGASGYRPEHTLAAYTLAIEQGADYIEVDLVSTRDGVLICRHDCEIGSTTDAAKKFPQKKKTVTIEGKKGSGFFAQDFTLDEMKTLRTRERSPFRSNRFDGQFPVPTFEEFLQLVAKYNKTSEKKVGICPEIKHPAYHQQQDLPLEIPLLSLLRQYGYKNAEDLCVIQSFNSVSLQNLSGKTELRLLQLLPKRQGNQGLPPIPSDAQLKEVATYADVIGVHKESIVASNLFQASTTPTDLITRAKRHRCSVWVYTFGENSLSSLYRPSMAQEIRHFATLGADGFFTDFPDVARRALVAEKADKPR
jgi:glycerophosphoryl diester phosphodiesterase